MSSIESLVSVVEDAEKSVTDLVGDLEAIEENIEDSKEEEEIEELYDEYGDIYSELRSAINNLKNNINNIINIGSIPDSQKKALQRVVSVWDTHLEEASGGLALTKGAEVPLDNAGGIFSKSREKAYNHNIQVRLDALKGGVTRTMLADAFGEIDDSSSDNEKKDAADQFTKQDDGSYIWGKNGINVPLTADQVAAIVNGEKAEKAEGGSSSSEEEKAIKGKYGTVITALCSRCVLQLQKIGASMSA
jgi:uncharacterized protein (UPF0335 family)